MRVVSVFGGRKFWILRWICFLWGKTGNLWLAVMVKLAVKLVRMAQYISCCKSSLGLWLIWFEQKSKRLFAKFRLNIYKKWKWKLQIRQSSITFNQHQANMYEKWKWKLQIRSQQWKKWKLHTYCTHTPDA